MGGALVSLAEQAIRADSEDKEKLRDAYNRFMSEGKPARKSGAGKDLIRAVFGAEAIPPDLSAKDKVR